MCIFNDSPISDFDRLDNLWKVVVLSPFNRKYYSILKGNGQALPKNRWLNCDKTRDPTSRIYNTEGFHAFKTREGA